MNTERMKQVGNAMMVAGGVIFGGGFGLSGIARLIDIHELRLEKEELRLNAEIENDKAAHIAELEQIEAAKKADDLYCKKLEAMDQKAFAKYQAESTAKASDEAIAKANKIEADALKKISEIELECSNKVKKAVQDSVEANEKYNELLKEFEDREEVLEAKEEIKKFLKSAEEKKTDLADLSNRLAIFM